MSNIDNTSSPHAIVIPFPTQGHVNPMVELSNQLLSKGVLVTLILTQDIQRRLNSASSSNTNTRPKQGLRVVLISDGLPDEMDRSNYWDLINAMNGYGNEEYEKVVHELEEVSPVHCIIADSFLPYTKHVAQKKGIQWVALWPQSLSVYTIYYHAFFHLSLTTSEVGSRQQKTIAMLNSLPRFPTMENANISSFLNCEDITNIGYQYFLLQFKYMQDTPILANSFEELEEESILAMRNKGISPNLTCIGPLLPPSLFKTSNNEKKEMEEKRGCSLRAEEWTCMEWLNQKAPKFVLYISFGSLVSFPKEQIEEILAGVCESGVSFLWAARDIQKDLEHMFAKYNTSVNPNTTCHSNHAMFVDWAPQLDILSHVAVGGFLTHVGWNSTLESISCGVPMLTMPCFSDQATNAKFVSDTWKVGLRLLPKHGSSGLVTRDVIKEGVLSLLSSSANETNQLQDRAQQFHEAAHRAISIGGSSHSNLQSFIKKVIGHSVLESHELVDMLARYVNIL